MSDVADVDAILDEVDPADDVVETPAATEPVVEPTAVEPTVEEPAPEPVAEQPASTLPEGYKRDAMGRVHGPDGRVISREEAAKLETPTTPATPVTPAPEAVQSETPVTPEPEPYWVRHAGQRVTIPHAVRNADGSLVIKPEGEAIVRDLFTQALAHRESWPREKQKYEQQIQQAQEMAKAAPRKYNDAAVMLWEHISNPEWLNAAVANPERIELLREKLALTLQRADLTAPRMEEPAKPDDDAINRAAVAVLSEELDDLLDSPTAKTLFGAEERKELSETMLALMPAFFTEHQGEIVLDRHALKRAFEREVTKQQRIKDAASTAARDAEKARKAAAFNAAQQSTKTPAASPAIPAKPKPVPASTAAGATKSWDQRVNEVWNSDDDDD